MAAAIVRGIDPAPSSVRRGGALAIVLAVLMVAVAAGTIVWWAAIASRAPWFSAGTPRGTAGTAWPTLLVLAEGLLVATAAVAVAGARGVAAALHGQT